MRTRYDQFGKQMIRAALEGHGSIETDAEVPVDTRRIDLWFMPGEQLRGSDHLGWLGHIARGPSTFELFHNTPCGDDLCACVVKHGNFRHFLLRRKAPPPSPVQWVISSGRPDDGINGLRFCPLESWPSGVYEGPPLLRTQLVVVNELPISRDTLLLRLLGAGAVLKQAIAELEALPEEARERTLALPILVRLRLTVPNDPSKQTTDDQEFLMDTEDIVETFRRQAIQEGLERGVKQGLEQGVKQGLEQGLEQGERKLLLRQLRRRFGGQVDGEIERRLQAASSEQIEVWGERLLSADTLAELLAG